MGFMDRMANRLGYIAKSMTPVFGGQSWFPVIAEPFAGAWQKNKEISVSTAFSSWPVFSCMTLIASDIAKLRLKLKQLQPDGTWKEATNTAYDPILRKPNDYQNRIQFWEHWILSKLSAGNTYALKQRNQAGRVQKLFVLNPQRVKVLISEETGDVFYELSQDPLNELSFTQVTVPASEIIHDRMNCLFHPLVGISPLYAAAWAALQALNISKHSASFFGNSARPSGILTAPGQITKETAKKLKEQWDASYTGENSGKVAVLGDNLKFESLQTTAVDSSLIEQLKWSAEAICACYHVPPYKIGIGMMPTYQNIQALNVEYYAQCLQVLIESAEECMDEGLGIGWAGDSAKDRFGVEFDVDNLLRMDSLSLINTLTEGVKGGVMTPNEARFKMDLPPVEGGSTPYMQQQNFSLAALQKRDSQDNPFQSSSGGNQPPQNGNNQPSSDPPANDPNAKDQALFMRAVLRKELGLAH
jgi:HK97 family phage portal protein